MDLSPVALLLSITIDIDPDIGTIFGLTITWHGLFTAIGIIGGVSLSVYLAKVDGIPSDVGQELALVSVICAIIGARLFFVFEHWDRFDDDLGRMSEQDVASLREDLLSVHGIGEETADDIILYAVGRPSFVIDAYTRRVFSRLGLSPEKGSYAAYQRLFEDALPRDPVLYGEYHALIVRHGKYVCKKRPLCQDCCLREVCPTGERILAGGECPG